MKSFTDEEMALLVALREGRKLQWPDIAKQVPGHSADSCRAVYSAFRRKRDGVPKRVPQPQQHDISPGLLPPTSDWHASLTAAILGDPLPGRSALDQRGATP